MVYYLPLNLVDLIDEVDCFIIYRENDAIYNNHDTANGNDCRSMYHDGDVNNNNLLPIDKPYINTQNNFVAPLDGEFLFRLSTKAVHSNEQNNRCILQKATVGKRN